MSLSLRIGQFIEEEGVRVETLHRALEKYHLLSLLPNILRYLKKREEEKERKQTLLIETPFPLSDTALKHIQSVTGAVGGSRIVLDESLLAGFRATHNDKLYDASLRRSLERFTR